MHNKIFEKEVLLLEKTRIFVRKYSVYVHCSVFFIHYIIHLDFKVSVYVIFLSM